MAIIIRYCGVLREPALILELVEEVLDICKSIGWHVQLFDPTNDIPVQGLAFGPVNAAPFWLTFQQHGKLSHPAFYTVTKRKRRRRRKIEYLFTNTHPAGCDAHMALIKLLRYLSGKYFHSFELHDDTGYWGTGNELACRYYFAKHNRRRKKWHVAIPKKEFDQQKFKVNLKRKMEAFLNERFGGG